MEWLGGKVLEVAFVMPEFIEIEPSVMLLKILVKADTSEVFKGVGN